MTDISLDFSKIQKAVAKQWLAMQNMEGLFRVEGISDNEEEASRAKIWATYLGAFPEGTDPMFRKRTQHDCSMCRNFVRRAGTVVALNASGEVVTLWDITTGDPAYDQVCAALSDYVKSLPIQEPFLTFESSFGASKTFGEYLDKNSEEWAHFYVTVPKANIKAKHQVYTELGKLRTKHQVMLRALRELDSSAIETVLELIDQNSLYRGSEFKNKLKEFRKLQDEFDLLPADQEENFAWRKINTHESVAGIRNSALGTLLVDLSEGADLEHAVRKYEQVVAPTNYRRPTALITQSMIDNARAKIEELGLLSALDRRLASTDDLKITDILFADRESKKKINRDAFDNLKPTKAAKHNLDTVEEITIEKFVSDVLPNVQSMELLFEQPKSSNLMTLVAPVDPTAGRLFSWKNGFSWAYIGDVTDSIKERVKNAGGNVTGDVCFRLAWYNHDDLDLHLFTPNGHIYYLSKMERNSGGQLDVDMNAGYGATREPVENIFFPDIRRMDEGSYQLKVHQFAPRDRSDLGFDVEVEILGDTYSMSHSGAMGLGDTIQVMSFDVEDRKVVNIQNHLHSSKRTQEIWGINTGEFHKVKLLMNSPNHWDGEVGVGNKHWFFIVDGVTNPEPARGFFNEYLDSRLNEHRKVFEVLGSNMKTKQGGEQLSGFGFSSTKKDSVVVKVSGTINRKLKINF